jgi:mannobiose 2-epimerase
MKKYSLFFLLFLILQNCKTVETTVSPEAIGDAMEKHLRTEILEVWYPMSVDTAYGGFISSFTYDFKPAEGQDKMIVTQARHTWTNAKAAMLYPEVSHYLKSAEHGFKFLRDVMWDKQHGGFYTLVDRQGNVKDENSKNAYGNAFGIYALAAYYEASRDTAGLNLAKKAFMWLENHSHDAVAKGYFQHLERNGTPIKRPQDAVSTSDIGYKDQNSSIHLLEAFTELYQVWPDSLVAERLKEMLLLIRDTITTSRGNLTLFLQPDWTPVSFADSSEVIVEKHHQLDHVSFGHDVETAYLLLEASHVVGLQNDTITARKAKRMVDHALRNGWDEKTGGFYDEGYYFKNKNGITITHDTKNWWAQAEGLNTLLLMSKLHPNDKMDYYSKFVQLWNYADQNLIDHQYGDWYAGGIDKQPEMKTAMKGHIWKATYHQTRSLINCIKHLKKSPSEGH